MADLCFAQKSLIHASALICADPNGKAAGHRQIKLLVRLFLFHFHRQRAKPILIDFSNWAWGALLSKSLVH